MAEEKSEMRKNFDFRLVPALLTASFALVYGCKPPGTASKLGGPGGNVTGVSNAADGSVVLNMSPNSAGSGPPDNIKVGTRITYYTATASVAGDGHWYEPVGPNEPFDFVDKKTDQHYKDQGQKPSGGSSEGYTEYNVVYMDGDTCVMEVVAWGLLSGVLKPLFRTPGIGLPGFGGGIWARPEVLEGLPDINTDEQKILRGPYKLGDKQVDSVWLSTTLGTGNSYYVYDRATGLMIRYGGSAEGTPGGIHAEGEVQTGGKILSISTLLAKRQVSAPWFNDPAPQWAQTVNELDFEGNITTQMPGGPAIALPVTSKIFVAERHPQWLKLRTEVTVKGINGMPDNVSNGESIAASAMYDPLWIQPSTLANLRAGQQLDNDPTLNLQTQVVGKKAGPRGDMMVIAETMPNGELIFGYDLQTGMLVYMRTQDKGMFNDTELTLKNSN